MDQTEINRMLQRAKEYNAEKYLAEAANLLSRNKKLDIEINDCEWYVNDIANRLVFKIRYSANNNDVELRLVESVFKDYHRDADEKIGIKPDMSMENKIKIRLAYVLYLHRDD